MAAQIIRVLILALALESQVKDRWRQWRGAFRLQTILALLLGELAAVLAAALGQVADGEYLVNESQDLTDVLSWLTVLGLVVGFAAVLWAALGQEEWAMRKHVRAGSAGGSVSSRSEMGRRGFEPPRDGS